MLTRGSTVPTRIDRMTAWLTSSLSAKITALVFAATAAVIVCLAIYFPAQRFASAKRRLDTKAATYATLLAHEVEPVLAFDDRETARETFATFALDPDVVALGVYTERGDPIFVHGEPGAPGANHGEARVLGSSAGVRVEVPVVPREGARGVLVVELSSESLVAERAAVTRTGAVAGLLAATLGLLAALSIGRTFGRRVARIVRVADAVAAGDLAQDVELDGARDEIGQLSRAFAAMLAKLRGLVEEVAEAGRRENAKLEELVSERTSALRSRTAELSRVLEHVGEGFFTVDRGGRISNERSAILNRWLGSAPSSTTLWDYLAQGDPQAGAWAAIAWEALVEDAFPAEVAIDQLPKTLRVGGMTLRARYTPIVTNGEVANVLVVLTDVTSDVAREHADAQRRDVLSALGHMLRDRAGFLELVDEGQSLIACVTSPDESRESRLRAIHTLKGTGAMVGLVHLAAMCHQLEDVVESTGRFPIEACSALEAHWQDTCAALGASSHGVDRAIDVDPRDYDEVVRSVERGAPRDTVLRALRSWREERVAVRLERLAEHAAAIAHRLEKPIVVDVEGGAFRIAPKELAELWPALTHVVRNAVDHGIEPSEARVRQGKAPQGRLTLRAAMEGAMLLIEIRDDGRGVDWETLAARARAAGLPADTPADAEAALFSIGISTRDETTIDSGRGVGLSAVYATCQKLGATVTVTAERGLGTAFRFRVPIRASSVHPRPPSFERSIAPPA